MKTIIKTFSEHGTFVQKETLDYILSKDKPYDYMTFITRNLKEFPLVLTLEHIKQIEHSSDVKEKPKITIDSNDIKKIQTKMLSTIFGGELKHEKTEEIEFEYDDPDKDDQIKLPEEKIEETVPQIIEIKKVKGWKPKAKEYDPEINIIKDVTGNSNCEGTTKDFTKLFRDRYNALRKIIRYQRREISNAIPIKKSLRSGLKEINIVGIVKDVRTTTNGHRLVEIEDETDVATCIALMDTLNSSERV